MRHASFKVAAATALLAIGHAPASAAEPRAWSLGVYSGVVYNAPIALRIEQEGEAALRMTARYGTRPLRLPPYYGVRLGYGSGRSAWELEAIHDKLYLDNTSAEVPHLEATHGYNLVLVNRSLQRDRFLLRAGVGAVILHLEGTVRGRPILARGGLFGTSYALTGPTAQLAVERPVGLGRHFALTPEVKATATRARISIQGGSVQMPNIALHAVVGLTATP